MILDDKKGLETIKNRLQKAYSMTTKEQKRWTKQIKELEAQAARLDEEAGDPFSDDKGLDLLIKANKELSKELLEEAWGDGINEFLKDNQSVNDILNKACDYMNKAFDIKSMTVIRLRIEKYKDAFRFIEKTYSASKTLGFRELTTDEEKEEEKNIEQIGWL